MTEKIYIGALAKTVGINPKTIRYYEEIGLVNPAERADSGYRLYHPDDARRLRFIKKAQAMGLSLEEIKEVLDIRESGALPCQHVRKLLVQHLDELDRYLKEMQAFRKEFSEYVVRLEQRAKAGEEAEICGHIEGFESTHPKLKTSRLR